jgi:RNA polymerase sigma factor (sigma-70 family)
VPAQPVSHPSPAARAALTPSTVVDWVARYVVPAEPRVRAALLRAGVSPADADDLIQEAYCRFAAMADVTHIAEPGAYFMTMVKNLRRDALRRAAVVKFEDITENAALFVTEEALGLEAMVAARMQLRLVERLLATLPERCATIFRLKRIEGLPQKAIAARLGVSESIVENDVQKGLKAIQRAIGNREGTGPEGKEWTGIDQGRARTTG